MVANLSAHKRGWDSRWKEFSDEAGKAEALKNQLLKLVDEDTRAFNGIMHAFSLPNSSEEDKQTRKKAISEATVHAIETPLQVMKLSLQSMAIIRRMAETGNSNSVSDAGVGALCARTAVLGAWLNVKINCAGFEDRSFAEKKLEEAKVLADKAIAAESKILEIVNSKIGG